MRNFRDAYKHAVDELPKYHIDAGKVQDELHHHRMMAARRRKAFVSAAAAVCVFLICGVGTATAMNYYSSTIKVREHGFSIVGKDAVILSEEDSCGTEAYENGAFTGNQQEAAAAEGKAADGPALLGIMDSGIASQSEEASSDMPVKVEAVVEEAAEYASIEEFRAAEDITIAIPEISWLGNPEQIESQYVRVVGAPPRVMINIRWEDTSFYMSQDDNRDNGNYASSRTYPGDVVNERMYANGQGMSYTVFDTQEDGEITATHAAVSVNGRDIMLDFYGYREETVNGVLKQLDLSVYVTEE